MSRMNIIYTMFCYYLLHMTVCVNVECMKLVGQAKYGALAYALCCAVIKSVVIVILSKHRHLSVVAGSHCLDDIFREQLKVLWKRFERVKVQPLFDRVKLPRTCLQVQRSEVKTHSRGQTAQEYSLS